MKATISTNKQAITLENGTVFNIEANETVADFMSRVRKLIKEEFVEDLKIEKAAGNPEIDALKKDLIEKSDANRKAKTGGKTLTPEEKAAIDAEIKAKVEASKQEALKAKEEKEAQKKLQAEQKAKAKEEEAKAYEEAKAKAKEEAEARNAELLAARKEELQKKAEEMVAEAKAKAEEMIKAVQTKAEEHVLKVQEAAVKMIETGAIPKAIRAASTPSGIRVEPEDLQIAYIDSIVGSHVSFVKGGNTIVGKITARSIDYRVGIVFARIVSTEGLTYHKSFNKIDELTFVDAPQTETAE